MDSQENADPAKMDLVDITKVAERQISAVRTQSQRTSTIPPSVVAF